LIKRYNGKLAIGVGPKDLHAEGYINADIREAPYMDLLFDASQTLPFEDESLNEILAESVLEHINHNVIGVDPLFRMTNSIKVLREWRRVLKPGGLLVLRLPNLRGVFKQYLAGNMTVIDFIGYVYGGGEYAENYHKAGFDSKIISACLRAAGFKEWKITDAHNPANELKEDVSWEMGVRAIR